MEDHARFMPDQVSKAAPSLASFLSANGYEGPVSDHFDGKRFYNPDNPGPHGFSQFLLWRLARLIGGVGKWPKWIDMPFGPPPPAKVSGEGLRATFVNHSTVLLQTAGRNILTDPIWSERASPVSWAGPRRRRPPGIRFEDLPRIDTVLISHNHYDHLDLPTLQRLAEGHSPRFVVGLGLSRLLASHGIRSVTELDWWQGVDLEDGLRVTAVPAQHFSARGVRDRNRTLWCGYVLEGPAGTVYYAADTGWGPHFERVRARFGPPRLALLPIGAYLPLWFMAAAHLTPWEAVQAHKVLEAGTSVAIHFGTFPLADDGEAKPVTELTAVLEKEPETSPRFWVLAHGEGRDVP
jgi:L-ascorbate metabolism protein UlaG (beta-lactamase superfamily)